MNIFIKAYVDKNNVLGRLEVEKTYMKSNYNNHLIKFSLSRLIL